MHNLNLQIDVSRVKPSSWQDYGEQSIAATVGDVNIEVRVTGIPENATEELSRLRAEVSELRADLGWERDINGRKDAEVAELKTKFMVLRRQCDPEFAKLREGARALIKADKFINAIKLIREETYLGLKEAKDMADEIRAEIAKETVNAAL